MALFYLVTPESAHAAEPKSCPVGTQTHEGVCLSNRMIAYLKCLDRINGGRIRIVQDQQDSKPTSVTVDLEGSGKAVIARGAGKVKIDTRNDQTSIRKLEERFSPDAVTGCFKLAAIEQSPPRPLASLKNGDDRTRTAKPTIGSYLGTQEEAVNWASLTDEGDYQNSCLPKSNGLTLRVHSRHGTGGGAFAGCCALLKTAQKVRSARFVLQAKRPELVVHVKLESEQPVLHDFILQGSIKKGRQEFNAPLRKFDEHPATKFCIMAVGANDSVTNEITVSDVRFEHDGEAARAASTSTPSRE